MDKSPETNIESQLTESVINAIYAQIAKEVSENKFDAGLWARAEVIADGDEKKARISYSKLRFQMYAGATLAKQRSNIKSRSSVNDSQNDSDVKSANSQSNQHRVSNEHHRFEKSNNRPGSKSIFSPWRWWHGPFAIFIIMLFNPDAAQMWKQTLLGAMIIGGAISGLVWLFSGRGKSQDNRPTKISRVDICIVSVLAILLLSSWVMRNTPTKTINAASNPQVASLKTASPTTESLCAERLEEDGDKFSAIELSSMTLDGSMMEPNRGKILIQNSNWEMLMVSGSEVQWYKNEAIRGNANAQTILGRLYEQGVKQMEHSNGRFEKIYILPKDYKEAIRWYLKGADQGNLDAQFNLGIMCLNNLRNKEAAYWFSMAVNQNDAMAQSNLGVLYEYGYGVSENHETAVSLYKAAASQGLASAQLNLGVAYLKGRGVPEDKVEAERWLRKAADQGLFAAARVLAR